MRVGHSTIRVSCGSKNGVTIWLDRTLGEVSAANCGLQETPVFNEQLPIPMRSHTLLSTAAVFLMASTSAFAQGQPNARESRHVGLDVLSVAGAPQLEQTTPGGITLTVHAPAGSTYDLLLDSNISAADFSLPLPGLIGPLNSPFGGPTVNGSGTFYFIQPNATFPPPTNVTALLAIGSWFTDPDGGVPGVISAGRTSQTLVSTFTLQQYTIANLQAAVTDPLGTVANPGQTLLLSNGQQRLVIPVANTLATSGYTVRGGSAVTGFPRDNEQGDLEADGDMDEAIVGVPSSGWTFTEVSFATGTPTRTQTAFSQPGGVTTTSGEFVDLDDDGYLDWVIGGFGPTLIGNLQIYMSAGASGGLLSGGRGQVVLDPLLAGMAMNITDVETADFNGDGLPDVYAACASGNCNIPELNRLFFGRMSAAGGYSLVEVTRTQTTMPLDDSEDCEVFDFDGDGDLDIVVANYDGGPTSTFGNSVNLIHINNGQGRFSTIPAPAPHLETVDVLAIDIDRNGLDDLYFGNFLLTDDQCNFSTILPDTLFLNMFQPGSTTVGGLLVDNTALIPLNDWATIDVEGVSSPRGEFQAAGFSTRDYDGDGDIDIFIGLGSFGNPAPAVSVPLVGVNRGLLILENQQVDNGGGAGSPISFVLDRSAQGPENITDIELGDWLLRGVPVGRWFEKDAGVTSINRGHTIFSKNQ